MYVCGEGLGAFSLFAPPRKEKEPEGSRPQAHKSVFGFDQLNACPALQRTFLTLWRTSSFTFARAGPKYWRGSNSFGFSKKALRIAAVMARRRSVSIFTLVQPVRRAISMSASG